MNMNIIERFFNRIRFRRSVKGDQSRNIVDGMVKARSLYRELSLKVHPDRNEENRETAEELMKRLVKSRYNYEELLTLKNEIDTMLNQ